MDLFRINEESMAQKTDLETALMSSIVKVET